jgi:hypothetical protein
MPPASPTRCAQSKPPLRLGWPPFSPKRAKGRKPDDYQCGNDNDDHAHVVTLSAKAAAAVIMFKRSFGMMTDLPLTVSTSGRGASHAICAPQTHSQARPAPTTRTEWCARRVPPRSNRPEPAKNGEADTKRTCAESQEPRISTAVTRRCGGRRNRLNRGR